MFNEYMFQTYMWEDYMWPDIVEPAESSGGTFKNLLLPWGWLMFDLLNDPNSSEVILSGDYVIPDGWRMKGVAGKRIIGDGQVRFIGRFIVEQCVDILFANCSFRAPIAYSGQWSNSSYDAVTVSRCDEIHFSACSILGGCDETLSIKKSTCCSIDNSIIGACFSVPRATGKTHSMAMLIECDDFDLTNSIVTACDRRKPQIEEWHDPESTMVIAGNRIDGGRTMTIGLKPKVGFRCDVVDNIIYRTKKTKVADIAAVNGSAGTCQVHCVRNYQSGTVKDAEIQEDSHLELAERGFTNRAWSTPFTASLLTAGPRIRDSWDSFVISRFGSGQTWASERELPAL